MLPKTSRRPFLAVAGFSLIALVNGQAANVLQVANDGSSTAWSTKGAPWGGAAPTADNDYFTFAGVSGTTSIPSGFGANFSSRLRDTGSIFGGNSLTIAADTEVLQKGGALSTTTGTIILDGGIFAYGNAGPATVNLAGSLAVPTTGILGMGGVNILNVTSTTTGSGTLSLRSSDTTPTIRFSGSLTGFTGTLQLGGGGGGYVTLDFDQDYVLAASIAMDTFGSTVDVLNLDQAITVNSFTFGATTLAANTYTAAELNGLVGNGSQFTGAGSLTVVPEPSAALLGALGALGILRRRRAK